MDDKHNYMAIFSLRMAGYLMMHGFVLLDMREHISGSGKKVFYFKKTQALESAMEEYKSVRNSHKSANNS